MAKVTIGQDLSLKVCKKEGYLMLSHTSPKKWNVDTPNRVFAHYPDYYLKECYSNYGGSGFLRTLQHDVSGISYRDVVMAFFKERHRICKPSDYPTFSRNPHTVLAVCDLICFYYGELCI